MTIIKIDKGKPSKKSCSLQCGKNPRLVLALHSVLTSDKSFNQPKLKFIYNNNMGKCSRITVKVQNTVSKNTMKAVKILYGYEVQAMIFIVAIATNQSFTRCSYLTPYLELSVTSKLSRPLQGKQRPTAFIFSLLL